MTASEELRALGEATQVVWFFHSDDGAQRYIEIPPALIADVVEAAEKVDEHMWDDGEELDPEVFGLRIASLGHALAALREHLEEK